MCMIGISKYLSSKTEFNIEIINGKFSLSL